MNDYLAHYGLKGMHWGERRYQNPDGTLTPEGRARYGVGSSRGRKLDRMTRGITSALNVAHTIKSIHRHKVEGAKFASQINKNISYNMIEAHEARVDSEIRKAKAYIADYYAEGGGYDRYVNALREIMK